MVKTVIELREKDQRRAIVSCEQQDSAALVKEENASSETDCHAEQTGCKNDDRFGNFPFHHNQ